MPRGRARPRSPPMPPVRACRAARNGCREASLTPRWTSPDPYEIRKFRRLMSFPEQWATVASGWKRSNWRAVMGHAEATGAVESAMRGVDRRTVGEKRLFRKFRDEGDESARERLVERFMP